MMDTPTNLPTLFHDPIHYEKTLKVFKEMSNEEAIYKSWYDNVFTEAVVSNLSHRPENGELRMLGIGSGKGEPDCFMLKQLLPKYPNIRNIVIEPASDLLEKYRHLVKSNEQSLSGVVFDWRQQKFENYHENCQSTDDDTKFHFIHAIHSLYHMVDLDATLGALYDRLEDGGILLVMITSEKSGIRHLHERFPELQEKDGESLVKYIKTADIRTSFDRRGITYKEYPQPLSTDVTQCFQEGKEEGDLLLDFLTHVINFRKVAPKRLAEEYLQYLKEPECSKVCGDKIMLNMDWDAIVTLPKSKEV